MKRHGMTLVELLITAVVLGILLTMTAAYFSGEARMTRIIQTRQDAQEKVRVIGQVVRQDLQMAGASRYVKDNQVYKVGSWTACATSACLVASPSGSMDTFSTRYITSLRAETDSCRDVRYSIVSNELHRSDVTCGQTAAAAPLTDGVLAIDITYACSDGTTKDAPACGTAAYPRAARLSVFAASTMKRKAGSTDTFTTASGQTITCPAEHECYGNTTEITLPNLKDR